MTVSNSEYLVTDILLHLAHAGPQYPGGIVASDLTACYEEALALLPQKINSEEKEKGQHDLSFVTTSFDGCEIPVGSDGELLKAVIEKGLKRTIDSVRIIGLATNNENLSDIAGRVVLFGEECGIKLGISHWQAGSWLQSGPMQYLCANSLSEIRKSTEKKRLFWSQLKNLL